jgi:hypothetical protein
MGGGSRPSAPPPPPEAPKPAPKPAEVATERVEAEKAASFKRARRGRSASLLSSSTMDSLGTDTTLGGGEI